MAPEGTPGHRLAAGHQQQERAVGRRELPAG
ncbi:hypothetical protein SMD44_08341 [Streptomyces alboflavus]|uniref:Uncharacterized protein n=1 Tax=Streptomyces alboflavus TaxID=67267 RepID=A0A1Z1WR22_9ACTN|nr:hypothetical protein SMD44_08341 [Streptomyces alboflavus]